VKKKKREKTCFLGEKIFLNQGSVSGGTVPFPKKGGGKKNRAIKKFGGGFFFFFPQPPTFFFPFFFFFFSRLSPTNFFWGKKGLGFPNSFGFVFPWGALPTKTPTLQKGLCFFFPGGGNGEKMGKTQKPLFFPALFPKKGKRGGKISIESWGGGKGPKIHFYGKKFFFRGGELKFFTQPKTGGPEGGPPPPPTGKFGGLGAWGVPEGGPRGKRRGGPKGPTPPRGGKKLGKKPIWAPPGGAGGNPRGKRGGPPRFYFRVVWGGGKRF